MMGSLVICSHWRSVGILVPIWLASLPLVRAEAGAAQIPEPIEEIVVHGEKLDRTLWETSSSVAIYPAIALRDSADRDITETFKRTPNVTVGAHSEKIIVRGIPQQGFGGCCSTVFYMIDGALYSAAAERTTVPVWDLEQLEILRGAQSTAPISTVAGVVSLTTRRPTHEPDGALEVRHVPEGHQEALSIAHGSGIADGDITYRVAGQIRRSDGFFRNIRTGDKAFNARDRRMARLRLRWEPRRWPDSELSLTGQWIDEETDGVAASNRVLAEDGFDPYERLVDTQIPLQANNEIGFVTASGRHTLNDRWNTSWVASHQSVEEQALVGLSAAPGNENTGVFHWDLTIDAVEGRVHYQGRHWEFTAALLSQWINGDSTRDFNLAGGFGDLGTATITRRFAEVGGDRLLLSGLLFGSRDLGERWTLDLGMRLQYTNDDATLVSTLTRTSSTGDPAADAAIDGVLAGFPSLEEDGRAEEFEPLPILSLSYRVSDSVMVGVKTERATRPGSTSSNAARAEVHAYDPELAWSYELFLRSSWLDSTLALNANAFRIEFEDQQVEACFSQQAFDCHQVNAQRARIQGLEVQADWALAPRWTVWLGAGLLDTRFEEFQVGGLDWSGNEMPQAPDRSIVAGARYEQAEGLYGHIDALYESDAYAIAINAMEGAREARFLVNARIGWRFANLDVSAFARNLLDEQYLDWIFRDPPTGARQFAAPGAPREIGVELELDW